MATSRQAGERTTYRGIGQRGGGLALVLALAGAVLLGLTGSTAAQANLTVIDSGVESAFPDHLVFRAAAQGPSEIERVRLRYEIQPDGTRATADAEIEPATSVDATVALQAADQPTFYLAPGTTITYHWEATDAAGNTAESAEATFFYNDDRFDWTALEQDGLTVYYYEGGEDTARQMLAVGAEKISQMSDLLGATVDFPVKVWLYDSVEDMRPALPRRSATYEDSVITAGIRITTDTVLVLGEASYETLRHELTHIVTAAAGEGGLGSIPAWLDEGTAVYGQGDPGGFGDAIDSAIDRGNVLSVRSITSSPGDPSKVNLFYGESWSLVSYLIDTYGEEKFAQLYAEIKSGKRIDSALEAVYGFDQDGLEDEWRDFHDLPAREVPAEETPPVGIAAVEDDDGGTSTGTLVAVLIGTLALAGVIGFAGVTIARRVK